MRGNGVSYDTGFINAGVSTHEPFDLEVVKREMRVIHDDLHCSPAQPRADLRVVVARRFAKGRFLPSRVNAVGVEDYASCSPTELLALLNAHSKPTGLPAIRSARSTHPGFLARPRPSAGCHRPGLYYRERTGSAWCGRGDSHGRRRPTRRSRGAIRPGAAKTRSANRRLSYGEIGA